MDCSKYLDMVSEEIDGELEESKSLFLMRHLVICSSCRNEYEQAFSLQSMFLQDPKFSVSLRIPTEFSKKVIKRIEDESALMKSTVREEAAISLPVAETLFSRMTKRSFSFGSTVSWAAIASLFLIISLTFTYTDTHLIPPVTSALLDAKKLKSEVVKAENVSGSRFDREDEIDYYLNRHSETVYGRQNEDPVGHLKGRIVSAAYYGSTVQ